MVMMGFHRTMTMYLVMAYDVKMNKNCQKTMENALWELAFKMGNLKSLDHEIYKYYELTLSVILKQHLKYCVNP